MTDEPGWILTFVGGEPSAHAKSFTLANSK